MATRFIRRMIGIAITALCGAAPVLAQTGGDELPESTAASLVPAESAAPSPTPAVPDPDQVDEDTELAAAVVEVTRSVSRVSQADRVPFTVTVTNNLTKKFDATVFLLFEGFEKWRMGVAPSPGSPVSVGGSMAASELPLCQRGTKASLRLSLELKTARWEYGSGFVCAPILNVEQGAAFKIREFQRVDARGSGSAVVAEGQWNKTESGVELKLLARAGAQDGYWEIHFDPLGVVQQPWLAPIYLLPSGTELFYTPVAGGTLRSRVRLLSAERDVAGQASARLLLSLEEGKTAVAQVIYWNKVGGAWRAYCPYTGRLSNARDPDYMPELATPKEMSTATHRVTVRPEMLPKKK